MKKYIDGKYIEMTPDEISVMQKEMLQLELAEKSRPFSAEEVFAMLIATQINTLVVDDNTALRMQSFYPEWAENTAYSEGFKVQYGGKLWKVKEGQGHTSNSIWTPLTAHSLWEQVNETHSGEMSDPIPYSGNMALQDGKYYIQDGEIYLCNRDTINAVFNPLCELVDIYVKQI